MSAALTDAVATEVSENDYVSLRVEPAKSAPHWSAERFAREQIRGLVRELFSLRAANPVRQIVFSGVGPELEVASICRRVGQTLASERPEDVAVVASEAELLTEPRNLALRQIAIQLQRNLWTLPAGHYAGNDIGLHSYMGAIRAEFQYSILAAPPAGESDTAIEMARFADGVVLVLAAQSTRRAAALRVKQKLEQARVWLLGTVLCDREFPIPESLYRRL